MEADGDHFLAYYLAKDDEDAITFKQNRLARSPDDPPEEEVKPFHYRPPHIVLKGRIAQPSAFHFVRDYETVKVEQEVPNEFLLVLDEGSDSFDADNLAGHVRPKGAYYKNIERKMLLKKKRVNVCFRPHLHASHGVDSRIYLRPTSRTATSGMS